MGGSKLLELSSLFFSLMFSSSIPFGYSSCFDADRLDDDRDRFFFPIPFSLSLTYPVSYLLSATTGAAPLADELLDKLTES